MWSDWGGGDHQTCVRQVRLEVGLTLTEETIWCFGRGEQKEEGNSTLCTDMMQQQQHCRECGLNLSFLPPLSLKMTLILIPHD